MADIQCLRDVLDYDPSTGVLRWKSGRREGMEAGCVTTTLQGSSYRLVNVGGKKYYAHRLIWAIATGEMPAAMIDHVNGDGLDNRWGNLREATREQNSQNRRLDMRSTTGVTGVTFSKAKGTYKVHIQANGVREYLGSYSDREDAVRIATQARLDRHGQFARF